MKIVGQFLAGLAVVLVLGTAVAAPAAAVPLAAATGAEAKAAAIAAKVTARADAVSAKLGALQSLLRPSWWGAVIRAPPHGCQDTPRSCPPQATAACPFLLLADLALPGHD